MLVLIGANGFLGRHTCELLERRGVPAIAISRNRDHGFFERFAPSLKLMDFAAFASPAGRDAIADASAIVYFRWGSVPSTFVGEPWREISENVHPALEFFQHVSDISPEVKIVFLSSGGTIYGGEGDTAKGETSVTQPISSHGLGKLMTEVALKFVGRTRGNPYAILRISNAVGRWHSNNAQGIVGAGLRAALNASPLRLFGGGTQVRDFVDADDVAEAIYAASADTTHAAATWNVGSGIGISMAELVERISAVVGRKITVETAPFRGIDVPHIVLDCAKIARDLGWRATTPLDQSISRMWEAMQFADQPTH